MQFSSFFLSLVSSLWVQRYKNKNKIITFAPRLTYILLYFDMYFTGIIIAVSTFLAIGIWHPIVIKTEYYWGTRPWIVYLIIGVACITGALFIEDAIFSSIVGVFGASALWGIGELFAQKKRVEKGWFPKNPKRKY
jgi:hypothetical protein